LAAFSSDEHIYVCDENNCRVQLLDQNGRFLRVWARPFCYPRAVAVLGQLVFVADQDRLYAFDDTAAQSQLLWTADHRWIVGIRPSEDTIVAWQPCFGKNCLYVYSTDGTLLRTMCHAPDFDTLLTSARGELLSVVNGRCEAFTPAFEYSREVHDLHLELFGSTNI
jgi:hypothetical protein